MTRKYLTSRVVYYLYEFKFRRAEHYRTFSEIPTAWPHFLLKRQMLINNKL